jgi:hypothetical protein
MSPDDWREDDHGRDERHRRRRLRVARSGEQQVPARVNEGGAKRERKRSRRHGCADYAGCSGSIRGSIPEASPSRGRLAPG